MVSVTAAQSSVDLPDFLQLAALARRSALVTVQGRDADGALHLDGGEIVHAYFGDLVGEVAVFAMLAVPTRCEVAAPREAPLRTVYLGTTNLLLEAARLQDEGNAPTPSVPPPARMSSRACSHPPMAEAPAGATEPRTSRGARWLLAGLGCFGVVAVSAAGLVVRRRMVELSPSTSDSTTVGQRLGAAASKRPLELSELGPDDQPPALLEGARPMRPSVPLPIDPTVIVRMRINRQGRAAEAVIYHPRSELGPFEEAALAVVPRLRFSPASRRGHAVEVWLNWPITFPRAEETTDVVRVKGSDTIGAALGPELARDYREANGASVIFEALGSATAFVALFDGTADIGAASRPASEQELERARQLGLELEEFVLGYDGVAVITHRSNPLAGLTMNEVARLFAGKTNWWAGEPGFPGCAVHVYGRPSYSGTHVFFRHKVLRQGNESGTERFAPTTVSFEKSEDVVDAVAKDRCGIGYVGLGFVTDRVRAVPLSAGEGRPHVAPSQITVRDGSYPVHRPLMFYTRGVPSAKVSDFLRFALSEQGKRLVQKHGFIAADGSASAFPILNLARDPGEVRAPKVVRLSFGAGSLLLTPEAEQQLVEIVGLIRDGRRAIVVGHADAVGSSDSNENIALARAHVVANLLRKAGIASELMQVHGENSAQPLSTNGTDEGRHRNRRVDVYVVPR